MVYTALYSDHKTRQQLELCYKDNSIYVLEYGMNTYWEDKVSIAIHI
jgi:hypothetical protein